MFTAAYGIAAIISVIALIYMAQKNYYNVDIYQWTIMMLVPVIVAGYWLKSMVHSPEAAGFLYCFVYLDSTVLIVVLLFSLLHTLGIHIGPWVKILAYGITCVHLAMVCLCIHTDLYYKSIRILDTGMGHATKVIYGSLFWTHFVYLGCVLLSVLLVLVLGYLRSGAFSKRNLYLYTWFLMVGLAIYLVETWISVDFTVLPFLYMLATVLLAFWYDRSHKYDLSFMVAEHQKSHQRHGYMAVGLNKQYFDSNEKCKDFVPFLEHQNVNQRLPQEDEIGKAISDLIDNFESKGVSTAKYEVGGMTCVCEISHFTVRTGGEKQGYLLEIRDGTAEQRAYELVSSYKETLETEVEEKTNNIRDIQRKIVLGMANMIENRDNNTGGHVKRTSDIIAIIVNEIQRQGIISISDEMAQHIVRAAPTHDLGKMNIDSSILNKPARLTDEEFAVMKTHSAKSGEMVRILLDGVEEEQFVEVAFNVARYHHERWDGRGYPDGLVGTMIPLEARIMAIADVYDALVSKRVYKEPMSFEKSAGIMCECMGTQFDPAMKRVFLGCREQLEEYYRNNN